MKSGQLGLIWEVHNLKKEKDVQRTRSKITNKTDKRIKTATILTGIVIFFALCLGIYHITHGGGWRSGTAELFFACFIAALYISVYQSNRRHDSPARYRRLWMVMFVIFGLMAGILLILSAYHYTHQGWRSGTIELAIASMLLTTVQLMKPAQASTMGQQNEFRPKFHEKG
jgi:multisubunit Na+/H+ antiporter MnhB subunit